MPRRNFPWRDGGRRKWLKKDKSENNGEEKELGFLDETSPEEMEEDVSDKKNDKSENNDERKEAEWLDDNFLDDMEEEVSYINDNKN